MGSVWRSLTAVGAGALLLSACAGPAEVPVIEAAEEAVEDADPGEATAPDEIDDQDGDGADTTGADAAEGGGDEAAEPSASDDVGAAEVEPDPSTPLADADLVASPCAAHEGRELEVFLDLVAPVDGQAAGQEVELVGCSNVYEATVNWRLLDEGGGLLDEGFTTAECGTGCVGAFRDTVSLAAAADESVVTLQVFWISPQDGSDEDLQERTIALG